MKKYLFVPILLISFFILSMKVGATQIQTTHTGSFPTNLFQISTDNYWLDVGHLYPGYENGYFLFTFVELNPNSFPVSEVDVWTSNNLAFTCELDAINSYYDNNTILNVRTAKCPVYLDRGNNVSITYLVFKRYGGTMPSNTIMLSNHSFTQDYTTEILAKINEQNYTYLLNTILSNTSLILGGITNLDSTLGRIDARLSNGFTDVYNRLGDILLNIQNGNSGITSAINNQANQQHNDSQAEQNAINDNTQAVNDLNNTISDSNVSGNGADDFFNNFQDNDHGLSSVITAPLNFIRSLASSSCSSISLTIPYVDTQFNLPCMSTIYRQNFGSLFTLYQTITFGIVAYYVCIKIYGIVKGFKNPDNDRIEVLEL